MAVSVRRALFAVLAVVSLDAFGQQNLLANGGFENPGFFFTPGAGAGDDFRFLNSGTNSALADWIVADNGVGQLSYIYHQQRYPVAEGNYGLTLSEGSSISASFQAPFSGLLNFGLNLTWSSECIVCYQPKPLEVLIDGQVVASFAGLGSNWRYSDLTKTYSTSFSVASGTHTLTLSNPEFIGNYHEYRIDQVMLTAAPVPEPEIAAMMILGFGFMGVVARRRRNCVAR